MDHKKTFLLPSTSKRRDFSGYEPGTTEEDGKTQLFPTAAAAAGMEDGAAQYAALLEAKSHWQRDAKAVLAVAAAAKDALSRLPPKRGGPVGAVGVGDESEEIKELGCKIQRQAADFAAAQLSLAVAEGKVSHYSGIAGSRTDRESPGASI